MPAWIASIPCLHEGDFGRSHGHVALRRRRAEVCPVLLARSRPDAGPRSSPKLPNRGASQGSGNLKDFAPFHAELLVRNAQGLREVVRAGELYTRTYVRIFGKVTCQSHVGCRRSCCTLRIRTGVCEMAPWPTSRTPQWVGLRAVHGLSVHQAADLLAPSIRDAESASLDSRDA